MTPYLQEVSQYVKDHVLGKEKELDGGKELPMRAYDTFRQQGLGNWWLAPKYGGRGLNLEQSVDVVSELAYGDAGLSFAFMIPILSYYAVELYGSSTQRERFLAPMNGGAGWGATMASEKSAGSELMQITTKAERQGDSYVLSGEKYFSSNAELADFYVIYVKTVPDNSFKAFVVPKGTPGLRIVRRWPLIGLRSAGTYEIALDNVRLPADSILDGNGLRILEISLNTSRALIATTAVGIAKRARDLCIDYARNKKLGDATLLTNAVFAAKLGQMEAEIETMTLLCKTAAHEMDEILAGPNPGGVFFRKGILKSVIVAKMMCGQMGWKIVSTASEMFGGVGFTDDAVIGKLVRDMRYVSLIEAGDDVLRALMYSRYLV